MGVNGYATGIFFFEYTTMRHYVCSDHWHKYFLQLWANGNVQYKVYLSLTSKYIAI
jgi:hypothetical protein